MQATIISLREINNAELFAALSARLTARFGALPTTGFLSGQAVASACYEIVGVGSGPMKDLDHFIDIANVPDDALPPKYNYSLARQSEEIDPRVYNAGSETDALAFEVLSKIQYTIHFSHRPESNPDLNLIGCKGQVVSHRGLHPEHAPLTAQNVIGGFDLNAVEIAMDMANGEVVYSEAFENFLYSKTLRVTRLITPAHTALRLFKKRRDLPFANKDIASEIDLLKCALRVASFCHDARDKNHLPTQLFSSHTVEREQSVLKEMSEDFSLLEIEIMESIQFYRLIPQAFPEALEALCEQVKPLTQAFCHTSLDAYHLGAKALYRLYRDTPSYGSKQSSQALMSAFDQQASVIMFTYSYYANFLSRNRLNNTEPDWAKTQFETVMKYLIIRDQTCAQNISPSDIKRLQRVFIAHPGLFNVWANRSLKTLCTMAKNVLWLEKNRHYFVVGLFERGSPRIEAFPSLGSENFKALCKAPIEHLLAQAAQNTFTPLGERVPSLVHPDYVGEIQYAELCSELDFIKQGMAQRHCVGGYYDSAKQYQAVVFAITDLTTGEQSTAHYTLRTVFDVDGRITNKFTQTLNLVEHQTIGNANVSERLEKAIQGSVTLLRPTAPLPKALRENMKTAKNNQILRLPRNGQQATIADVIFDDSDIPF